MILYFSGTGNSAYVAQRIGQQIQDEAVDLFDKIKNNDFSDMHSHCRKMVGTYKSHRR